TESRARRSPVKPRVSRARACDRPCSPAGTSPSYLDVAPPRCPTAELTTRSAVVGREARRQVPVRDAAPGSALERQQVELHAGGGGDQLGLRRAARLELRRRDDGQVALIGAARLERRLGREAPDLEAL